MCCGAVSKQRSVCGVAARTLKLRVTPGAAAYVVSPAWEAWIWQLPAETSVSVSPLTVQTAGVDDARLTARPDVAVATNRGAGVPSVWSPGDAKLMVCAVKAAAATAKAPSATRRAVSRESSHRRSPVTSRVHAPWTAPMA